jgi:murein L,D-transpeptidase YcbB/YkuD
MAACACSGRSSWPRRVLAGDPTWTPEAIDATIAAGETVRAPLSRPIAVYLLYWTAYVGPDGQMNFRDDPYGWDRELVQRIAAWKLSTGTRASTSPTPSRP